MDEAKSLNEYKEYVKSMLNSYSNTLTKVMFDDLKVRAVSKEDDEFAAFTMYLNTLIASLQRKDTELKNHQENLGKQIVERTKELEISKKQLNEKVERLEKNKIAMLNMMEDLRKTITHLEEADKKITFLKEYNENILESNPNPIMVIKGQQIEYVNNSFIPYFGETKNDCISKNLIEVMPSEAVPVFEDLLKDFNDIKELQIKDRVFSASSFVIEKAAEEERIGIVMQDVTKRKKAEEELKKKINELERYKDVTVGRELKMIELKKEINNLCKKCGEKSKYKTKTNIKKI